MFDVVVVGSANLDLVVRAAELPVPGETLTGDSYDEHPGGKGLNQAVAAARSGARTAFVGAFGDDDTGERLRAVATHEGVDTSLTPTISGAPTGRALICVARDGENTIVVVPGANAVVDGRDAPPGRVVLAQLEIPISAVVVAFRDARRRGATTILNPAPAAHLPDRLLQLTDIIVPNEHEVGLIGGVDALLAHGVSTVIVTRAAAGVDVTRSGPGGPVTMSRPVVEVEVVDTTGAGDAFCGALAARLAEGADLDDAVEWAIVAAGISTTRHGATPSLASRDEIVGMSTR